MRIIDKCKKLYGEMQYEVFRYVDPNQSFPKRYWFMSAETYSVLYEELVNIYVLTWEPFVKEKKLFDIPIRIDQTVTTGSVQLAFVMECYDE